MATSMTGTNPVVHEHQVGRFTFRSARPVPGGHRELVWRSSAGQIYSVGSPPTTAELMFGTFQAYEVDVAQHPVQIVYELPSKDSARTFHAILRATWKVTDAAAVVRDGIVNAEAVHDSWLNQILRDEGSQYSIYDERVEQKINAKLAPLVGRTLHGISIVDLRIEISLDEATATVVREALERDRAQVARLDTAEKDAELARVKAELDVLQAEHDHVLAQRQQEYEQELEHQQAHHDEQITLGGAKLKLALEAQAQEQELALKARVREQELALQAQAHEQELRLAQAREVHELDMKQRRMQFYVEAFEKGNSSLILLQLIEHPQDVAAVVAFLIEQRKVAFANSQAMLQKLIDADAINPATLDEHVRTALGNVLAELQPSVGGLALPSSPGAPTKTAAIEEPGPAAASPEEDRRKDTDDDDDVLE